MLSKVAIDLAITFLPVCWSLFSSDCLHGLKLTYQSYCDYWFICMLFANFLFIVCHCAKEAMVPVDFIV